MFRYMYVLSLLNVVLCSWLCYYMVLGNIDDSKIHNNKTILFFIEQVNNGKYLIADRDS